MEQIVFSGTKLNISYWVDELLDDDSQLELYDYFKAAKDNSIEKALQEFGTDYEEEELRIYRLKFYSDVAI
jgi:ATP-dependent DNA helicase RecQ